MIIKLYGLPLEFVFYKFNAKQHTDRFIKNLFKIKKSIKNNPQNAF
jgi:hypothetical protein